MEIFNFNFFFQNIYTFTFIFCQVGTILILQGKFNFTKILISCLLKKIFQQVNIFFLIFKLKIPQKFNFTFPALVHLLMYLEISLLLLGLYLVGSSLFYTTRFIFNNNIIDYDDFLLNYTVLFHILLSLKIQIFEFFYFPPLNSIEFIVYLNKWK